MFAALTGRWATNQRRIGLRRNQFAGSPGTMLATSAAAPVQSSVTPLRTHQVLAEALTMCKRGDGDDDVLGLLKRRGGLNKLDAASAFSAVERHLTHSRASARSARNVMVISVLVQLLLTVATFSIDLASAPAHVLVPVGLATWLFRGDLHVLRRAGRWVQSTAVSF